MEKPPSRPRPTRAERQAAALRANLKRRKAAAAASKKPEDGAQPPSSRPLSGENSQG
jgi:hypothetical protein